jgi:hypothetical protein
VVQVDIKGNEHSAYLLGKDSGLDRIVDKVVYSLDDNAKLATVRKLSVGEDFDISDVVVLDDRTGQSKKGKEKKPLIFLIYGFLPKIFAN